MRVLHLLPVILVIASSCNTNDSSSVKQAPVEQDTLKEEMPQPDQVSVNKQDTIPFNIQVDTVIHFAFAPDSATLTARGSINKDSDPVSCYLTVDRKGKFTGTIIPDDSNLNIRFSQLIMPDKKSDGPFTKQLKYDLDQRGVYKIIIGPNNMAEGKRSGDFSIRLELK